MPQQPPADAPQLTAWLDTDGENDQLHLRVSEGDAEYERVDADIGILAGNNQYLPAFENAALTLSSLYERAIQEERERGDPETVDGGEAVPAEPGDD